ncbi:MAG: YjcZ family sporulation protein [Bacillota bacterium]
MSAVNVGYGGWLIGVILVLFILLVIILRLVY